MPHAVAAGIASTALTAPVVAGGLGALGTGLAAGATLGGAAGLTGLMGGLGSAGALAPGAFGALAPSVAVNLAPAAAAQAAGTIGTVAGSVAPGAFGANLAGAAAPGLTGSAAQTMGLNALKSQVIGTGVQNAAAQQATNLAFQNAAAQNMANAAGSQFAQAAPNLVGRNQVLEAFSRQGAGQGFPQLGEKLAGATDPLAFKSALPEPSFLKPLTLEGSALPGVTSNLPAAAYGNAVTAPAIPGVTSSLPVAPATTQIIPPTSGIQPGQNFLQNIGNFFQDPSMQAAKDYAAEHPYATAGMAGLAAKKLFEQPSVKKPESNAMIRPYTYERTQNPEAYAVSPTEDSSERNYFNDQFIAGRPYEAAGGGIVSLAVGGPVEQMAAMNAVGANTNYPQANLQTPMYSNPAMQRPEATNVIASSADAGVGAYTGEARFMAGGITTTTRSKQPETTGGYTYSYNPNTMQFTQQSVPMEVYTPRGNPVIGGSMGTPNYMQSILPKSLARNPQPVKNSGAKVSGGIAPPAMGPMQTQQAAPINIPAYQTPEQQLGLGGFYNDMNQQIGNYTGYARGGNVGGEAHLGDYSDGGRLLRGPGDGVSDSIPASIGGRQPARLADGEFVVPARIVSELGNGSTEAGARKLYAMMERIQKGRSKSVGKGKVAVNSKAAKYLPA